MKKIYGCEGNTPTSTFQGKMHRHPYKKCSENVFAYSCVSEHFEILIFFPTKTYIFLADKGFAPGPLNGHVR